MTLANYINDKHVSNKIVNVATKDGSGYIFADNVDLLIEMAYKVKKYRNNDEYYSISDREVIEVTNSELSDNRLIIFIEGDEIGLELAPYTVKKIDGGASLRLLYHVVIEAAKEYTDAVKRKKKIEPILKKIFSEVNNKLATSYDINKVDDCIRVLTIKRNDLISKQMRFKSSEFKNRVKTLRQHSKVLQNVLYSTPQQKDVIECELNTINNNFGTNFTISDIEDCYNYICNKLNNLLEEHDGANNLKISQKIEKYNGYINTLNKIKSNYEFLKDTEWGRYCTVR